MIALVQALQVLSAVLWLVPALYLSPRIRLAFQPDANRFTAIAARNAFLAWLMVGYVVRWLLWRNALGMMATTELIVWGALYALSCVCALWFFRDARASRQL